MKTSALLFTASLTVGTIEGNWYDMEEVKMVAEKKILRILKSAVEAKESTPGLTGIK